MALGIFEDTGSFTFSSTTPEDMEAGAYLLRQGADLNVVAQIVTRELTAEQVTLLNDLIAHASRFPVDGIEIVLARTVTSQYVSDFAVLAHKFMDMENLQVLFALAQMEDRVFIVGRSRLPEVNVGEILAEMGGGRLGANGSHQIDLLRFWLGEIAAVSGEVRTLVPDRVGPRTGERWTATADDMVGFTAEMASGAVASVFLSGAARHNIGNSVHIFGSEGTIMLADRDERLLLARAGEDFQDVSEADPNAALPGIGKGIWNVSFVGLIQEVTAAIREGRPVRQGATFADGWRCQLVMDAVRQSSQERRWIALA